MNFGNWRGMVALVCSAALISACGGGSGASILPGTGTGGSGSGGTTGVANVALSLADSTGVASTSLSPGRPLTATAKVVDASGNPVASTVVTFATSSTLAVITPASGTAITNSSGIATVQLSAASATAAGAATLTASAVVGTATVQGSSSYAVSAGTLTLSGFSIASENISAYGTTSVQVTVNIDGVPTTSPVTVAFTSGCAASGKAELPASVQTVGGIATATYTDKGCSGTDTVTVTAQGVSRSGAIGISQPQAANLQYVSALPATIYLKGTGLVEVSTVTFKVVDDTGQPVASKDVALDLDTRTGGVKLDGGDVAVTKKSAADGTVSVTVTAGTNPTPVFVKAKLTDPPQLSSQSNRLTISTGLPTQDSFSLSVGSHNIEGLAVDGTSTSVGIIASDRLGNPVPDGTAINFIVEGAQVSPSNCTTVSGRCSVTFLSAERRPFNDSEPSDYKVTSGRVTLLAYTLGEESFKDINGNNTYDPGEAFTDLGDVFIDANESGAWNSGEQYVPYGSSGTCSAVGAAGDYGNALSKSGTCDGVWGRAHVRRQTVITLSGSVAYEDHLPSTKDPFQMAPDSCGPKTFSLRLHDVNHNPMPAGTKLATSNNFVKFDQAGSSDKQTAAISIVNPTVIDSNAAGGTWHQFTVYADKCVSAPKGSFQLDVTSPRGTVTPIGITIN